jgi:hypothetical protein
MNERNELTVKTAGGTARVDREEKKERSETTRGTIRAVLILSLLGNCLIGIFGRAVINSSDWILGVVYLKSARRF